MKPATCLLVLLTAACATRADVDDPTPPTVELKYHWGDFEWLEVPTGGVDLDFPDEEGIELYLWAVGEDSGGVERVVIRGNGERVCFDGASNETITSGFSERSIESSSVGDGDRTISIRNVIMHFTGSEACDAMSHTYKSGEITFTAMARNFAGDEDESPEVRITR